MENISEQLGRKQKRRTKKMEKRKEEDPNRIKFNAFPRRDVSKAEGKEKKRCTEWNTICLNVKRQKKKKIIPRKRMEFSFFALRNVV